MKYRQCDFKYIFFSSFLFLSISFLFQFTEVMIYVNIACIMIGSLFYFSIISKYISLDPPRLILLLLLGCSSVYPIFINKSDSIVFFFVYSSLVIMSGPNHFRLRFKSEYILAFIIFIFSIFSLITLSESEPGRYALLVGDPNYTYSNVFTVLLMLFLLSCERLVFILITVIAIGFCVITGSRMGYLVLLIFLVLTRFNAERCKQFAILLLLFSVLFQPVFSLVFQELLPLISGFNDSGNYKRFAASASAVEYIHQNMLYLNGMRNLSSYTEYHSILPHNWFLRSALINGVIPSLVYVFSVFYLIKVSTRKGAISIACLCFMGTFLGYNPMLYSILLITLSGFLYSSKKHGDNL